MNLMRCRSFFELGLRTNLANGFKHFLSSGCQSPDVAYIFERTFIASTVADISWSFGSLYGGIGQRQ